MSEFGGFDLSLSKIPGCSDPKVGAVVTVTCVERAVLVPLVLSTDFEVPIHLAFYSSEPKPNEIAYYLQANAFL